MRNQNIAPPAKQWAQVAVATGVVAGFPVAFIWWLRASGTVSSPLLGLALGVALSLGVSSVICIAWEKWPGSSDLLFSELMIWGFLRRLHSQRRLACALDMLGPLSDPQRLEAHGMSAKEQVKLLESLVAGTETRDPYLHDHSRRVARHSWMIARRMGLPRAEVARIRTAASIHDVGKIETPNEILQKPGPLTDDEFAVIKRHPGDGALMVDILRDPALTSMVRHHHERLDGSGYPDGLSGTEIPLGARIIAVADTFDAITSKRPYRPASPHKRAIDILKDEAGTKLDRDVVRAFCGHYAGRAPIALWSSIAGLPERAVSWFASSVGSVASVAKVAAVAVLVSSAAVTTSTRGLPVAQPLTTARAASKDTVQAPAAHSTPGRTLAFAAVPSMTRRRYAERSRPAVKGASPQREASATEESSPAVANGAQPALPVSAGGGSSQGKASERALGPAQAAGKSEESSSNGKHAEGPGTSASQERPGRSSGEEAHAKNEEAPNPGHSEEAHATRANTEESPGRDQEAAKTYGESSPGSAPAPSTAAREGRP